MDNLITLENLKEKLPPWNPNSENQLFAIVDMGSNGIRFSITSLAQPTTRLLLPVYANRARISLFDILRKNDNLFPKETIGEVVDTLLRFKRISIEYGVPDGQFTVLATQAMRTASNAADMLTAINERTKGISMNILDPTVETLFGAVMGSRSGLVNADDGALFLDMGGGSVQMTWVKTGPEGYEIVSAKNGTSLKFGAVALMDILNDEKKTHGQALKELDAGMSQAYDDLCSAFPDLKAIKDAYENGNKQSKVNVYMCGGGFRGYGSMLMHNDATYPYPIASTNAYTAPGKLFKKVDKMSKVNEKEEGERIFGMSKRRRAQFPAIALVIEAFIKVVPNIGNVSFSGGSNRQGALMMMLPFEIRESNPIDVLAAVSEEERPIFDAVSGLLQDALPREVDFSEIPTVFTAGLDGLFVRDIWGRAGYDKDADAAYALNNAILRDPEAPGLTHLGRALLALTGSARWDGHLGPDDAKLFKGLTGIVESQSEDSPVWAAYIGVVANVIAAILPVFPKNADEVKKTIRITSSIKKHRVVLLIGVASNDITRGLNLDELVKVIEGAAKKRKEKSRSFKISAKIHLLS
ncbi:Ppx/GppA phosphatase family-domain-containing protein [Ilyonectria sp. MPI-CAGE-AT-0026]|nr:Ppx/GppA phosphatase family-domain-containing protein [Ilyonectria sp. MPI-CAGE-AT-0026]